MGVSGRQLRVYLVEDSAMLLSRLVELLEGAGVAVVGHADTTATAIREIDATAPDVVIIDIALRHGNGFDVLALSLGSPIAPYYWLRLASRHHPRQATRRARVGVIQRFLSL